MGWQVAVRRDAGGGRIRAVEVALLLWYVELPEPARRRGIAGKPAQAAFAVRHACGLPDLHADGHRTDLGERFAQGLPDCAGWRLGHRTHRLPPMTPGEAEPAAATR